MNPHPAHPPSSHRPKAVVGTLARPAHEDALDGVAGSTRLNSLNPSLLSDLLRFSNGAAVDAPVDLLAVLAAAVRHNRSLRIVLSPGAPPERVVLTVYPPVRLAHCGVPLVSLLSERLTDWRVRSVEPAQYPRPDASDRLSDPHLYTPLPELLWTLALRGAREDLLPEISGVAAYRVAPSANLRPLGLTGTLAGAADRLRRQTTNLREIARWPGFDRPRAQRFLNGLYLQAALVVTRSHPAATNDGWQGGVVR